MSWFRQAQSLKDSSVKNSTVQLTQAGRDALSFQNSEQVTIIYNGWFGSRQVATGIDWEWAGRAIDAQRKEVNNRLHYVLLDRAPMNVQLSEQPEQVNLPALESERRLTIDDQDPELLGPGQLMIEVFGRRDIAGKLLILGTPGAGKTTVLLSLAEQLLLGAIANPKTMIPIVFELSTWKDDKQSIENWLVEQLYDLHGGDRKLKRYEQWLEQRVLLPLLDGLDELGMERQKKCMAKLNEFTRQYPQVVVCCRSREFEESEIRLGNLRGAVVLEPLSDRQIQTYLHQAERTGLWTQIQETPEMRQMLEPKEDGEAGLLRVPLFVSIAAAIYDVNQPFRTKGELLERYIDRQLSFDVRMNDRRKGLEGRKWAYSTVEKEPIVKLTRHYLAWLAQQLNEINEVDFLIEKMQPNWLKNKLHEWCYWALIFIGNILTTGVVTVVAFSSWRLPEIPIWSVVTNQFLLILFLGGFMLSTETKSDGARLLIYPIVQIFCWIFKKELPDEFRKYIPILHDINLSTKFRLKLHSPRFIKNQVIKPSFLIARFLTILPLLLFVRIYTILPRRRAFKSDKLISYLAEFCISVGEDSGLFENEVKSVRQGKKWFIDLVLNLIIFLFSSFPFLLLLTGSLVTSFTESMEDSVKPNQGLKEAAKTALWTSIGFCIFCFLAKQTQVLYYLVASCVLGIIACSNYLPLIKHSSLRFTLWQSSTIPWNYAQFLNYCHERKLLQCIGGRYRFIHRELLDHFAKG